MGLSRPRAILALCAVLAVLGAAGFALFGRGGTLRVETPPGGVPTGAASDDAAGHPGHGIPAVPAVSSDPAQAAAQASEACGGGRVAKTSCYEGILVSLVSSAGVEVAMETLRRLGKTDQDVQRDGHVYAHAIGIEAFRHDPDVSRTFGRCTELFQSGCYHGVIQAYFQKVDAGGGARTVNAEDANTLCSSYRGAGGNTWLLFQCVHGMGHGLTMFHGHDLTKALADCDLLEEDWDRHSCYGGAFMENIVNATQPHHGGAHGEAGADHSAHEAGHAAAAAGPGGVLPTESGFKALDPGEPLYPCSILADRYLVDCYQMQTSAMLWFNHGDIAGAARTCDRAPEAMRPWCYQSLGRDISSYTLQDPAESIRMCSLGSATWQPWCYVGLVKNFVDLTAKTDTGFAFCREVPGRANKLKCHEALGEEVSVLASEPARRAELCARSEEGYAEACRYGARLSAERPDGLPVTPGGS
jgi:hypothetical protein